MDIIDAWLPGIRLLLAVIGIGSAFTFSVAAVCKLMKWAPVNITVNVYKPDQN
jgi:uncharacterized membrane protein YgaE (UPF0421/DUF939 family)